MSVEEELTIRIFEDLKQEALKSKDFDKAAKRLANNMGGVPGKCIKVFYDISVCRGDLLQIELLPLQEKNDLKEMAKRFCDTVDYCRCLHLFICWMNEEKQD